VVKHQTFTAQKNDNVTPRISIRKAARAKLDVRLWRAIGSKRKVRGVFQQSTSCDDRRCSDDAGELGPIIWPSSGAIEPRVK